MSVPFVRFVERKRKIDGRKRWEQLTSEISYFEEQWKPQVRERHFRFLFIRMLAKRQQKGPIQLDLLVPHEYGHDFKVIVTNKTLSPNNVVAFHEGRGSQEGIFGNIRRTARWATCRCRSGWAIKRLCWPASSRTICGENCK